MTRRLSEGGYAAWQGGHVPQEGGWDAGVGRSSSI